MKVTKPLQLLLLSGSFCAFAHASSIFNFDDNALGTTTNFTDTINGITADFSSPGDPSGFVVYPSIFETLTGNVLGDPGPAGLDGLTLDISLSAELSAVTLNFATSDFLTPSAFTLTALQNSTVVGTVTSAGSFLPGFSFPEGEIAFGGTQFNKIELSSTATDFAVDNINVVAAPEPSAAMLMGFGLALMCIGMMPGVRLRAQKRDPGRRSPARRRAVDDRAP